MFKNFDTRCLICKTDNWFNYSGTHPEYLKRNKQNFTKCTKPGLLYTGRNYRLCAGIQIYVYLDSRVHSFLHLNIYADMEILRLEQHHVQGLSD